MISNKRVVWAIAIWMVGALFPFFVFFQRERGWMPATVLEGIGMIGIIWVVFCALGLVLFKELARFWTVRLFAIYLFWTVYVVCFDLGPFFSTAMEWLGVKLGVSVSLVTTASLVALITHMTWPLIVIMYLTNPHVKSMFQSAPVAKSH
ncbi:MAG: hypothetical protein Q8Q08_05760 [Candidatus Omnitrophota bacterium]|nr:hypothetical protein [Candidatus Omnitrophota bacterium]